MLRVTLILILCLCIAGCQSQVQHQTGPPLPLRLAYSTQHDCGLVHIALARGFMRDEGLSVETHPFGYGKAALQAVLEGKADVATVAQTPVVFATLQGQRLSLLASIFTSNKNHAILADRKSGVARPSDLKGRRIGFTAGTTTHMFLSSFLTANGLSIEDVVLVPLLPEQMQDALLAGRVDAVSTWVPNEKIIAGSLSGRGVIFEDPYIYTETFVIAGQTQYVASNQEAMRRLLRALVRAEKFAAAHPKEAQSIVAAASKLPPAVLSECWGESERKLGLDHALLIALEDETRWAGALRLVREVRMPNYLESVDPRPLLAVKPEAVGQQVLKSDLRP
ncbi:NrtA/SsuA/CpmA family ABC transporter substrate-binding protein [Geomonas subterranea]|uniref:NrtA/SsuA/CpmA family ABC transporter substrate-binding protein n=1 Tax=Geomonas subterranea TaxID=2847989 RepID=A0ABX8LC16_9BACT|nr:NrtA/SsuA/CpmA family ABC transporter substrate-binding protein [Geomonas subterranea]QXE89557.1 NrtA/SsuA/CpmA family ABC transporter substrate-binding protein [Geomonas subterranea]QXM08328.1 NrtA/SsuA/CpmA family ABC transporter substrate-binding protein [Geomonas subterranea]